MVAVQPFHHAYASTMATDSSADVTDAEAVPVEPVKTPDVNEESDEIAPKPETSDIEGDAVLPDDPDTEDSSADVSSVLDPSEATVEQTDQDSDEIAPKPETSDIEGDAVLPDDPDTEDSSADVSSVLDPPEAIVEYVEDEMTTGSGTALVSGSSTVDGSGSSTPDDHDTTTPDDVDEVDPEQATGTEIASASADTGTQNISDESDTQDTPLADEGVSAVEDGTEGVDADKEDLPREDVNQRKEADEDDLSVEDDDANTQDTETSHEEANETPEREVREDETLVRSEVQNAENRHQFSEKECVLVADGAYYCQRISTTNASESEMDIVFSRLTDSGYRDIFLRTTREVKNITNSAYNDAGPHYDPVSETVVWHREIDGRYQIMSYDTRRNETTQLTNTRSNNMEPVRSGDLIVWQRWIDDRWQIILKTDGAEERQLTSDSVHNLAPYVRGSHIIWNTYTVSGEPRIAVYDTETEHISYIGDSEDGRVSNPRFVLVYDTLLPSGDRITQEFDPETGISRPVSGIPAAPLPDIPSSDPVGEVRALQNKSQEDESEALIDTDADNDNDDDAVSVTTSSSTDNVASSTRSSGDIDMRDKETKIDLSEYDVVVPDYDISNTVASGTAATSSDDGADSAQEDNSATQ